jgi:sugar phosphate permease
MAIPAICKDLSITKSDIGTIISSASVLYGVGKCFFGVIAERFSARYVMTIGLLFSAFMNIFMGLSSFVPAFTIFWSLNHCFQSMGAPPCIKLLTHWYGPSEIGTKWALWNMSHQIGSALIVSVAPFILMSLGWRYVFFLPGMFAIILAIVIFNRLRDTPESLRLPSIEKMTDSESMAQNEKWKSDDDVKLTYLETLKMAVCNRMVWCIGFANLFVYICRMTFLNWGPTLLIEMKGSTWIGAGFQMVAFDMASMLGGVCAGYMSDRIFKGRRGPVSVSCMILFGILVTAIWLTPNDSHLAISLCLLGVGFLMSGPQILIGVAAADFASKKAASTANGFTGTFGYVGTAISGFGGGFLADNYGWGAVFVAIIMSTIAATLLLSMTWNKTARPPNGAKE